MIGVLPRHQLAIAAVVTRSHMQIPAGFAVAAVNVDGAAAYARAATRRLRTLIGLPELMVKAIGGLLERHPRCFAAPTDDRPGAANVGVTVDIGTGLYVPVLPAADRSGLREIGALLLEYRRAAIHRDFRTAQLADATITLTLATDGPLFSRPIIFPGQVCAVSLGTTAPRVGRDSDSGEPVSFGVAHVGIAYDHRTVDDRDATAFLGALKSTMESLDGVDGALD